MASNRNVVTETPLLAAAMAWRLNPEYAFGAELVASTGTVRPAGVPNPISGPVPFGVGGVLVAVGMGVVVAVEVAVGVKVVVGVGVGVDRGLALQSASVPLPTTTCAIVPWSYPFI